MLEHFDTHYRKIVSHHALPRPGRKILQFLALLIRELTRDQFALQAGTLSYWSLVATVPVLVLAVTLLRTMGLDENANRDLLYRTVLAAPVASLGLQLSETLDAVDLRKLGFAGVVGVLFTGSRIFFSMEAAYNRVFAVRTRRRVVSRFLLFYATVTLGPVFLAYGFHLSSQIGEKVSVTWGDQLGPVLISALVFSLLIRALPDTKVTALAAVVGGVVTAVLFEIAKKGFGYYVDVLGTGDTVAVIYGSLALFPVFLLWLYILWVIVLIGVEVAYVVERREDLFQAELRRLQGAGYERRHPDVFFALQCLEVVVAHFIEGKGPIKETEVTRAVTGDPVHVVGALENLEEAGILAESPLGYVLAIPAEQVTFGRVMEDYRRVTRPATGAEVPDWTQVEDRDRRVGQAARPA